MVQYRNKKTHKQIKYGLHKKNDLRIAKEILKIGILRRHEEWQKELATIISKPYHTEKNAFDRSMEITKMSKDFFKEAMRLEDYYDTRMIPIGIIALLRNGNLDKEDLSKLSEGAQEEISTLLETL